jgi:flagellar hook-basal body complex protein FliE
MAVLPATAAAAYQSVAKLGGTAGATSSASATNFTDFLSNAVKDSMNTIKGGEQAAMQQTAGHTDVVSVVTAMNNAELTLNTVVAVRDKVINAYQSILQMPI